jgi:hypothetical protein
VIAIRSGSLCEEVFRGGDTYDEYMGGVPAATAIDVEVDDDLSWYIRDA